MPIDSLKVSRHYRSVRDSSMSLTLQHAAIKKDIQQSETLDPTVANKHVYNSRADWYATAAITGLNGVDLPVETGVRNFLVPTALRAHSSTGRARNTDDLY